MWNKIIECDNVKNNNLQILKRNQPTNQPNGNSPKFFDTYIHTLTLLYTRITVIINIYSIWALDGAHACFTEQFGLISAIDLLFGDVPGRPGPILILGINHENKVNPHIKI